MQLHKITVMLSLTLLAGCFTLHETEPVAVTLSRLPGGKDVKVALSGFATTVTEFIPIYGYDTMYVDGGYYHGRHGRRGYRPGYFTTATTETLIPQVRSTEAYLRRAQDLLEQNGFLLRATPAQFTVDVAFAGPFITDGEKAAEWAWMLCSVFSAEYSVQTWTARLRVYDNASGKVVLSRDYSQKYDNVVWSPLFFIGLSGYDRNTYNYMQDWCLTALTDRAMADVTAHFVAP